MTRYELLKQVINNHGYCSVDKQNMDMIEKEIRVNERAELLDKVHVRLCDEYFSESNEEWNRAIDRAIEIVKEMKAEVEK